MKHTRICISILSFILFSALAFGQSTPKPLAVELVTDGLSEPIGIFSAPRDPSRLFVIEKSGSIRVIKNGVLLNTPFLDLTAKVTSTSEQGLLGLAFHTRYAQNGYFYVNYTRASDGALTIERYQVSIDLDVADPASVFPILTIPKPFDHHAGGMIAFSPIDRYLYISTGDGGSPADSLGNSQNLASLLGKLLRIDVDSTDPGLNYHIPTSNPFYGSTTALNEIFAYGLRNPWRFSIDRATGDIYIADVGEAAVEEIDYIPGGAIGGYNFGWNCMEGRACQAYGVPSACFCGDLALTMPIYVYDHFQGCAVIGGYVYRGSAIPDFNGYYIFADICKTKHWIFQYDGTLLTNFQDRSLELLSPGFAHTIASFGEDANGELYYAYMSGHIGKIVPADGVIPGVAHFGNGTPGCNGPQELLANNPVKAGGANTYFRATNAPAGSVGILMITDAKIAGGSTDPLLIGADFDLDFFAASEIITIDFQVDENGVAYYYFDLFNNPTVIGLQFYGQAVFYWGTPCPANSLGFSTTNALEVTIQP